MFRREYLLKKAKVKHFEFEKVWERWVNLPEWQKRPTVFYGLESSYSPPKLEKKNNT
jgi:hypothetical protein